jgi:tetratricopeptide (TPR) repeat protein
MSALLFWAWCTSAVALGQEPATKARPAPGDAAEDSSVTGKALPPIAPAAQTSAKSAVTAEERAAFEALEFEPVVYRGATALSLEPKFVDGIRDGLDLIYKRDYTGARKQFETVEASFPNTGVFAVGQTLIWQALMLENFDFKYDKQYEVASKAAEAALEAQRAVPGNDAWERFLLAGVVGIESIHKMRKEQYLPALQRAFQAMDHIAAAATAAPDFPDTRLADGMYNYWRTVVTITSKVLPEFGDHRADGIAHMEYVETNGIFLAAPATLALAFTWIEEGEYKKALTSSIAAYRQYPDNVINNLVLGRTYLYLRKNDSALRTFDEILADAPDNDRAHYYKGMALQRLERLPDAKAEYERYLQAVYMEPYQRSAALYRLGTVLEATGDVAGAKLRYDAAFKVDGNKSAKAALERMKKG